MRVLLTGGGGMVGRSVAAQLAKQAKTTLLAPSRAEVDLLDAAAVRSFLRAERPDVVVHAAGRVGGIADNISDPTGFLRENTAIGLNVIGGALDAGVPRLLNIGSSCMYPRNWRQPLVEEDLLQGELEPTNEGYALAKLMAERLCRYAAQSGLGYRTAIPSNLYGPHDHFEEGRAHLVAAAIAKVHRAKETGQAHVDVWGDGTARREFTFVTDVAQWIADVLPRLEELPVAVNVGLGEDRSVREYYELVCAAVGFTGELRFDPSRPAGMRQKLMDSSRARDLGWAPSTSLESGIAQTYDWYVAHAPKPAASGAA